MGNAKITPYRKKSLHCFASGQPGSAFVKGVELWLR